MYNQNGKFALPGSSENLPPQVTRNEGNSKNHEQWGRTLVGLKRSLINTTRRIFAFMRRAMCFASATAARCDVFCEPTDCADRCSTTWLY